MLACVSIFYRLTFGFICQPRQLNRKSTVDDCHKLLKCVKLVFNRCLGLKSISDTTLFFIKLVKSKNQLVFNIELYILFDEGRRVPERERARASSRRPHR
jgi:hypothetical protein